MNSLVTSTLLTAVVVAVLAQSADRSVADKVMKLTRDSTWTRVASIPIAFRTFHPQGMVKIGDTFYVSSVEVTKPTTRFATPVDGKDRDAGAGVGHLFKINGRGALVADVRLGEGTIYHPGGIDYDGKHLGARGGIPPEQSIDRLPRRSCHDGGSGSVPLRRSHRRDRARHGRQHAARRELGLPWLLSLAPGCEWAHHQPDADPARLRTRNPSHYVDYQDCKYAGAGCCARATEIRRGLPPLRSGSVAWT